MKRNLGDSKSQNGHVGASRSQCRSDHACGNSSCATGSYFLGHAYLSQSQNRKIRKPKKLNELSTKNCFDINYKKSYLARAMPM